MDYQHGGSLKFLDPLTGKEAFALRTKDEKVDYQFFQPVAVSPDGKRVVAVEHGSMAYGDGRVNLAPELKVWDVTMRQPIFSLKGHTSDVTCVTFSSNSKRIISGGSDKHVKVWNWLTGKEILSLAGHREIPGSVALRPMASGLPVPTAKKFAFGMRHGPERLLILPAPGFGSLLFSPDRKHLASIGQIVTLWNANESQNPLIDPIILTAHRKRIGSFAFSADGKRMLTIGGDGRWTAKVWNMVTGQNDLALISGQAYISANGKRMTATTDGTIKIFDVDTGEAVRSFSADLTSFERFVCTPTESTSSQRPQIK